MEYGFIQELPEMYYVSAFSHLNSDTADSVITGVGFQPRAIIFFVADLSVGNQYGVWYSCAENAPSSGGGSLINHQGTSGLLFRSNQINIYETGANFTSGIITSFDSDGFTIDWTVTGSPTDTARISFLCLR